MTVADSIFLRSLKRLPVSRTPAWVMRQAGRYLPEYKKTRAQAGDFMTLCRTPELACEVTLQPLRRFALDAAILFSDILTIPDAMGLGLSFVEGEGPKFERPLRDRNAIMAIDVPDMQETLQYVFDAVRLIRQEMPSHLPLIGFAGSPWTLACYMVEGQSSREFKNILKLMYNEPELLQHLLSKLSQSITHYLSLQVEAGANALMIFDTWGGILAKDRYFNHSLHYMGEIVESLKAKHPHIPIILFSKGAGQWVTEIARTGCDGVGLDWTASLAKARSLVGHQVALQGNLDPSVLLAEPHVIREEVRKVLDAYGTGTGHIFNLGHGITPDVPPDHLAVMLDALHEMSPAYHSGDPV